MLDAPGWKVDSLGGDGIMFRNGDADLEITSYAAKDYDSYVEDREHIVDPPAPREHRSRCSGGPASCGPTRTTTTP